MRRKDREITDKSAIYKIIEDSDICRIGFYDGSQVYIVPLSFGYDINNDKITFYFHSAKEGRKLDLISKYNNVGFEIDTNYQLYATENAYDYTAFYQSVIGNGVVSMVDNENEKAFALQKLMFHYSHKQWEITENLTKAVTIFKLEVTTITAKENKNEHI